MCSKTHSLMLSGIVAGFVALLAFAGEARPQLLKQPVVLPAEQVPSRNICWMCLEAQRPLEE